MLSFRSSCGERLVILLCLNLCSLRFGIFLNEVIVHILFHYNPKLISQVEVDFERHLFQWPLSCYEIYRGVSDCEDYWMKPFWGMFCHCKKDSRFSAYEAHYTFPLSESGFNYVLRLGPREEADQGTLYLPGLLFDYYWGVTPPLYPSLWMFQALLFPHCCLSNTVYLNL